MPIDATRARLAEARNQAQHRALAAARRPNEGGDGPLLDQQARVAHGAEIRIKSGKRRYSSNQYSHRMGVVVKAVDEFLDVLVDHGVTLHLLSPLI